MSDPDELRVPFDALETDEALLTAERSSDIDCVVSVLLEEPELEKDRLLITESRRGRLARDHATKWLWTYNNERPNMANGGLTPAQKLKKRRVRPINQPRQKRWDYRLDV